MAAASLQYGATAVLNLALAVAVGAVASWLNLARLRSPWATGQAVRLQRTALGAVLVAATASAGLLWLAAAAMEEVALADAGPAARLMLTATHLGLAWQIGIGALLASTVALVTRAWRVGLAGMAVFLFSRSMVSHAAANGDLAPAVLVDWVHLMLICLWVGEVCVSGLLVLAARPAGAGARGDCAAYIETLSTSATWALVGIFATGAFSAWHNLHTPAALIGNPYGAALVVKLALVGCAALLGGANRFIVMPQLQAALRTNADAALARFVLILRVEAAVLLAVLIVAAALSATAPPA